MYELRIELGARQTAIQVEHHLLREVGTLLRSVMPESSTAQVVMITDRHVGGLYGPIVAESLSQAGFSALQYEIEPGEASKSLAVAGDLYQFLAGHFVARDAVVVALGGGVVSDLAGFVAATWMRGVRLAICPTTMEADVDACLGGKTAVNVPGGKNLVGAFHQPVLVAVDPLCVETLDDRDRVAGLAESIKHAMISSEAFLEWHEAKASALLALDRTAVTELISENLRIKAGVVEQDPLEQTGLRAHLNFGHTVGHAIEACSGFSLRHGECVSLGMVAAARLSHELGLLDAAIVTRLETILNCFGLPTRLANPIETDRIVDTIQNDKKVRGGAQRFVLLEGIGRPAIREDVGESHVREAFESLLP